MVQYTAENEFHKTRKVAGQGIVVGDNSVVLVSSDLIPEDMPLTYVKHLVVQIPHGALHKIPATYLGRTVNGLFCYVQARKRLRLPPLNLAHHGQAQIGEQVCSIGLLPKDQGYRPYFGVNRIKAIVPLVHPLALTEMFGLTSATSPVYDYHTGALIGITVPNPGESLSLELLGHLMPVLVKDPQQEGIFLTWRTVAGALCHVPTRPFHAQRPWLGVLDEVPLKPALRKLYHIRQHTGIVIGSVIAGMPAARAGLRSQDIILTVNGRALGHSPIASMMLEHFMRAMQRLRPGETIKLGILRHGTQHLTIPVKVGLMPTLPSREPHYYDPRLGLVVRNLAFADIYSRKLPATQQGVLVALVKAGSPAALGQTPLQPGDIITQVNAEPIRGGKQLLALLKADRGKSPRPLVFLVIKPDDNTAVCRIKPP